MNQCRNFITNQGGEYVEIINPIFAVQDSDLNMFTIRKKEYEQLESKIRRILEPAEELGFEVMDFGIREPKYTSGELAKTVKSNLVIKLQKGSNEVDLSMAIPKLIDDNYIVINGRKKIPLFQMFDIPIVTRGDNIKLRTNVATVMVFEQKEIPRVHMSFLGKKIPMSLAMLAYYGYDKIGERFGFDKEDDDKNITIPSNLYGKLLLDLKEYWIESDGLTQDDFIKEIGKNYSQFNYRVKGEDFLYAIDLIKKTDIITAEFLETDNIIEELIRVMQEDEIVDDLDFRNKRIRCFEYIILGEVSKAVFDMCMTNRTARQPKFNVSSTRILSACNVSDIIQYDFAYSPIEELTKLSRTSLVGPGGFSRKNVPHYLRDISPTMFGRICPVDTPDRDNCGVLQNLVVNAKLDSNLRFSEEINANVPISIPVSMVPFLENDDQTRLQMSSSQMRQAILLQNFDQAYVQSGCEGLYTDYTKFIFRAKKNGEVVYVDNKYLIVVYEDGEIDMFDVGVKKIYVENMDIFNIYVKQGDKFKAKEILAESNYSKDGKIQIGRNLLTAVMVYYGHNYEDGIVISDRLVEEGTFTSIHYKDLSFNIPMNKVLLSLEEGKYKPLPEIDQTLGKYENVDAGNPYAILKDIPFGATDYCSIFNEEQKLIAKKSMLITEVNIYANNWNTEGVPEYKNWVESKLEQQEKEENAIASIIGSHLSKDETTKLIREKGLNKFSSVGSYKIKGQKIDGIYVEMTGIYKRPIKVGDKIGNRHGNKGVISKIVQQDKMPMLEDGRHADICINPLGIISRMNIGQLYEMHLGMSVWDMREKLKKMLAGKEPQDTIKKYLSEYIEILDNTKDKWYITQFNEQIKDIEIDEAFIDSFTVIQPPFECIGMDRIKKALTHTGTEFEYDMHDPVSKQKLLNKIAAGYMYFFRMVHIAESRLAARGIGSYSRRTLQPLGGRKNRGGQRCGEMETACLIGLDATNNLFEFLTTKSDCIDLKNRYIKDTMESDQMKDVEDDNIIPESVKLMDAYLTVIGVENDA